MTSTELENAGTELLRRAGAFRRGSPIKSPRMLRAAAHREHRAPPEETTAAPPTEDAAADLRALAETARLTAPEHACLLLNRLERRSLIETAAITGLSVHLVRKSLQTGLHKCRRASSTARELFQRSTAYRPALAPPRPPNGG